MGHQRELVSGVEPHDVTHRPPCGKQRGEPTIGKDALDEVLAQPRIVEPPFFFDRQQGKAPDQGVGKQPASGLHRHPGGAVHLDALEAAGGRVLLQHEADTARHRPVPRPGGARSHACAWCDPEPSCWSAGESGHRPAPAASIHAGRPVRIRLPGTPAPSRRTVRAIPPGTDRACGRRRSAPALRADTPKSRGGCVRGSSVRCHEAPWCSRRRLAGSLCTRPCAGFRPRLVEEDALGAVLHAATSGTGRCAVRGTSASHDPRDTGPTCE